MDEAPKPLFPTPALLTLIARHLATEELTREQILDRYDLREEFYEREVLANPFFQKVLEAYTQEWNSLGSTQKRLAFQAAAALEEKMPVLTKRMGDERSALADAVATAKLFKDLAGIAPPSPNAGANSGQQFSISINFGAHKVRVEADNPAPPLIEEKPLEIESVPTAKDRSV